MGANTDIARVLDCGLRDDHSALARLGGWRGWAGVLCSRGHRQAEEQQGRTNSECFNSTRHEIESSRMLVFPPEVPESQRSRGARRGPPDPSDPGVIRKFRF